MSGHPTHTGPRVFISYRTADTGDVAEATAGLLRDDLGGRHVFRDKDDLVAGQPWRPALVEAVDAADAVVVLVGSGWLGEGADGRRMDAEDDPVRQEVERALSGPQGRAVIPVLVDGAPRPGPPPECLARLAAMHAVAARRTELVDRESSAYQQVLVGIWSGLRARVAESVLVLADDTPLAQARLDELLARMAGSDVGEVVEISRFVSGAALVTVRSARRAARRWPDVVVLAEGVDRSATLRARLDAAVRHPNLAAVAIVGGVGAALGAVGATAGAHAFAGIGDFLVSGTVSTSTSTATSGAAAPWTHRVVDAYQARPRAWWAVAAGAGAAGVSVAVLAGGAEIGASVEHAGFVHSVSAATLRANPPGEADSDVDPDPDLDHYVLDYEVRNLGVDTEAARFLGIKVAETWTLLLEDGREVPAEGLEESDYGWLETTWSPGSGDERFGLSFPVPPGEDVDGARLRIQQFAYEPSIVELTQGEVLTLEVPVDVADSTYRGALGWWEDLNTYDVVLSDVRASLEASVDESGEPLPALDYGLRTRASEGQVFVHFTVSITPVDKEDWPISFNSVYPFRLRFPVPYVEGRALPGGSDVGRYEPPAGSVTEPITVRGLVEMPIDATAVGLGLAKPDEVGVVFELDPEFLEEFR